MWSSAVITRQPRRARLSCTREDAALVAGDHARGEDDGVALPQRDVADACRRRSWPARERGSPWLPVQMMSSDVVGQEAGLLLRHEGREVLEIAAFARRRLGVAQRAAEQRDLPPGPPPPARAMLSTRAMLVAKQVTATRPFSGADDGGEVAPHLGLAAGMPLHQRVGRSRRPWRARPPRRGAAKAASSVGGPISGSGSSFQSPVCSTSPCRVRMASACASGTECATRRNSRSKGGSDRRPREGHGRHLRLPVQPRLAQLAPQHGGDEGAGVDRAAELRPEMRHRADMVLMRVGDDQADQPVAPLRQPARVRHHHLDFRLVRPAEADAAIHRQQLAVAPVDVEVHPDLAGAAERDEGEVGAAAGRLAGAGARNEIVHDSLQTRRSTAGRAGWSA